MSPGQIIHHGGHRSVTGSCHELRLSDGTGLLVDCGLFQGDESDRPLDIDFPVDHLLGLVLTHVHIDHVGRLPYLLAAGYRGPIYCSEASAALLPTVLADAMEVGITRNQQAIDRFLRLIERRLRPLAYGQWHEVSQGHSTQLDIRLQPAGHILGSSYLECKVRSAAESKPFRVLLSGDLGAPYAPLLPAPKPPYGCDILVLEATYGNRRHQGRAERRKALQRAIEGALVNRGAILVPAFSIGRTQELLYELEEIIHLSQARPAARNLPWSEFEILLDSPLASEFTKLYQRLQPFWDAEARRRVKQGRRPLSFPQLTTIDNHRDHLNMVDLLKRQGRPCLVIAASGMCSGGRIVNYLKALLGDSRTDVLFTGYQAAGSPGRAIQQYGPQGGYVVLDGKRYPINARIHTLSGYSAHADQKNLLTFIRRMRLKPKCVHLVHGEQQAREILRDEIVKMGIEVVL
ncbi:MAG: MBL fold hydrolase [Desulfuromonas sp.]|nr:MAG: MBL fold hydrolase [Desulfuromonas sp.]